MPKVIPSALFRRKEFMPFAVLFGSISALVLLAGCASVDSKNERSIPWNRPTKEEISQGWWFQRWEGKPGDHYP